MLIKYKKAIVITVAVFVFLGSTFFRNEVVRAEPFQFTPTADPVKYGLILTLISEGLVYTSQKSSEAFQAMAEELSKRLTANEINTLYSQVLQGYVGVTTNIENQAKQLLTEWGVVHQPGELVNYKAAGLVEKEEFRLGQSASLNLTNGNFVVIRFPVPNYSDLSPDIGYNSYLSLGLTSNSNEIAYFSVTYYAQKAGRDYVQDFFYHFSNSTYGEVRKTYNLYGNTVYLQTSPIYKIGTVNAIDITLSDSYGVNKKVTYTFGSYNTLYLYQQSGWNVRFFPTVLYRDNVDQQYVFDPADYSYSPRSDTLSGKAISVPVGADGVALPIDNLYSYPQDQIAVGAVPVEGIGTADLTGIATGVNTLVGSITGFFDLTKPVNWEPMKAVGVTVTNKFPFSLPWDVARGIQGLEANMERPKVEGDWQMPWGDSVHVKIEVPPWMDPIFSMIRGGVVVLFVAGLIFAHGRLMGGQK